MRIPLLMILLLVGGAAFSQSDSSLLYRDTARFSQADFIRDSLEVVRVKLIRPQFRFDNRNIYFKGQMLSVGGYDAGVLLKDKLRVTLGYYRMNDNLSTYDTDIEGSQYDRQLKLAYGTLNTELLYINRRFFSLGMPLEFGFGQNVSRYKTSPDAADYVEQKGFLIVTDFGLSGTFKPIRWVGIRAVVGYRKNVVNQVEDFRFDGIFTSVGLNIDFHEITKDFRMYRVMKRHGRIESKIGTAVDLFVD
jgi:hypothetical protein